MARRKRKVKPLATIWKVSDELSNIVQPTLDELHLPGQLGHDLSVHRTFQRWVENGVLERI